MLTKLTETSQLIQFEGVYLHSQARFSLSVVYGANDVSSRRQLWEDLLGLQPSNPWLLMGDFNCIHNTIEKWGSRTSNAPAMVDFNAFIDNAFLVEMPTTGMVLRPLVEPPRMDSDAVEHAEHYANQAH